ncbi:hypothetical protein [Ligilactobacillus agilis]|uniref:hypothetical protein n=1 Tax=Ligilactobacillus agilis TaxID=1601 RepID=UPI00254D4243|nr:hypothetical protein [Ligilactobacillus agilis]MDK6809459.1 hypothetical protein [Ligilactobacillus agilis]
MEFFYIVVGILLLGLVLLIKRELMIRSWAKCEYAEITPYDFSEIVSEVTGLDTEEIPYNRVRHFSAESGILTEDEGVFAISYDAHPHDDEVAFVEYGILVTTKGILIKNRVADEDAKGEYKAEEIAIPYQDIFFVKLDDKDIIILRKNKLLPTIIKVESEARAKLIVDILKKAIESGWSLNCRQKLNEIKEAQDNAIVEELTDLDRKEQVEQAEAAAKINEQAAAFDDASTKAVTLGMQGEVAKGFKLNQINDRFGGGQGHGHAAEQAGQVKDFWLGRNPVALGGTHEKHGADRVIGLINKKYIQTKFYASPSKTIGAVFSSETGQALYVNGGKMMTIEVPKDQHSKCVKLMAQKISEGKVPGETNPANAAKYVKKGLLTYRQSQIATKSIFERNSTIEVNGQVIKVNFVDKLLPSVGLDFATGAALALPGSLVSFVWVYANSMWQGTDSDEALNRAAKAMLKPILTTAVMYTVASQFSKTLANAAKNAAKNPNNAKALTVATGKMVQKVAGTTAVDAEVIASKTLGTLAVVATVGPDVTRCLVGKISPQQLTKNLVSTGAGMVVGGWLGSVVPVVGTVVGAAVGGVVAKKIMDKITPDDNIIMSRILREEFIEIVLATPLSQEEFEDIINNTFRDEKNYPKLLTNMFSAGGRNKEGMKKSREYIDEVLTNMVTDKFTERDLPESKIIEAVKQEKDNMFVMA